jgi:hypothetical protein
MVSITLPAGAAPSTVVGTGDSVVATESLAAIDGPGHHFGFSQASVLAQATASQTAVLVQQTQTAVAAVQTQQAAPRPGQTGTTNVPCTSTIGSSCAITGAVSGTFTKTGSGTVTVTAAAPATAILNDGTPILFVSTTSGVEQINNCTVPVSVGGSVTCTGNTVGDILAGSTVTVRFVTTGGFQDVTGVVAAATAQTITGALAQPALTTAGFTAGATQSCVNTFGNTFGNQGLGFGGQGFGGQGFGGQGFGFGNQGFGNQGFGGGQNGIGSTCTVTGAVTGTATITGSATWNLTVAAAPAGSAAGSVPAGVRPDHRCAGWLR